MTKIGVIGLGDIARKAYLPVYSAIKDVEFHFYTRNQETLRDIANQYRFEHVQSSLDDLINSGITAAFVHSATVSHEDIVELLLNNNIHVFVDKPITDYYEGAKRLVTLAEEKGLILMAGFNRRYAPSYNQLKQVEKPNLVMIQKNRHKQPGKPRTFIYDDFIHVVDTMRYLFPHRVDNLLVTSKMENGLLYHVVIQFLANTGETAIGIMNRDNGTNEEIAQVMGPDEKRTVHNVSEIVISKGSDTIAVKGNDWEPTLSKRGFQQMVADFIGAVQTNSSPKITAQDALETHEICERILGML
jgi:virulence factor